MARGAAEPPRRRHAARTRGARPRAHLGTGAQRGGRPGRRRRARASPPGADSRADGDSYRSAAHDHGRGARARCHHPRRGVRVTGLSIKPRRAPQPEATLRPATLADVAAMETLMAPFVATGDLLPRSNYDLCRHIKEYVVALAPPPRPDGSIVGTGSL